MTTLAGDDLMTALVPLAVDPLFDVSRETIRSTCGCGTTRETICPHVAGQGRLDIDKRFVRELVPTPRTARCSGGCYCVKDSFVWRCTVCHHLC